MIMMLAVSAVCSASNGKVLDAEEAIVDKFINGGNYKAVTSMMTEDMQKNWDEKAYNNLHAQLAKDFGKLTTNQLIVVENIMAQTCCCIRLLQRKTGCPLRISFQAERREAFAE